MNSESTLSDALSEVDVAIAASNFERAIALTDDLLATYPDAVSVWRARARAFSAADKPFQAAEAYGRILDALPTDADAMVALAKSLSASGRRGAAKLLAQQALDYNPTDEALQSIAAGFADVGGEPVGRHAANDAAEGRGAGERLRGLDRARDGSFDRSVTYLRGIQMQRPDRVDVHLALAHALWRDGSKIAAAEVCQSILDVLPDCLEAHALLLSLWKEIGPANLEQAHLEAIARLDPDHRCVKAALGDASPVEVADVPAIRPTQSQPERAAPPGDDEQSRTDWVDDLVAAASSTPQPLERITSEPDIAPASWPFEDDDTLIVEEALDEFEGGADRAGAEGAACRATDADTGARDAEAVETVETLLPLEWEEADPTLDDSPADEDHPPAWLPAQPGGTVDGFTPSRPKHIVPDAKDGVPAAIEPLEWEPEAQREDGDSDDSSDGDDGDDGDRRAANVLAQVSDSREPQAPPPVTPASTPPAQSASIEEPSSAANRGAVGLAAKLAARQAVQEGRWQDALALYEKAILRSKGEQLDEIIHDLETLIPDRAADWHRFLLLGLAHMRKRDVDAALDTWQRAMALTENSAE